MYVEKDSWSGAVKIFGLTITGGTGAQEPYGEYSSADYQWNYYYKTITIASNADLTITGTGDTGANIIIRGGWRNLTLDNVSLSSVGSACITVNSNAKLSLTLKGNNSLVTAPKYEYGNWKNNPAISLNNAKFYLRIEEGDGYLTATTNCDGMRRSARPMKRVAFICCWFEEIPLLQTAVKVLPAFEPII